MGGCCMNNMNYNKKSSFIILIAICCQIACSGNSNNKSHDTTTIDYNIKQGDSLPSKDWHCYNVDEERICIPTTWKFKRQSKVLFFSDLDYVDSNSYFVILKYNKLTSELDAIKYLKTTYVQLKKDPVEKFTGYTVKKLTFADKETYYSEYYTSINKRSYMTLSTVFESGNNLFEIALKVDSSKINSYRDHYKNILFNFYIKNEPIFSDKDVIKGIDVIDLSKL